MMIDRGRVPWLVLVAALVAGCGARSPTLRDGQPRLIALADGTVRDEATGLAWSGNGNLAGFREPFDGATWEEAERFVAAMNRGERTNFGHDDWRLPSVNELGALFSSFWVGHTWIGCRSNVFGTKCADISSFTPFVDLQTGTYWTMTPAKDDRMWSIDVRKFAMPSTRDAVRRVLPVRGAPPASEDPALRPLAPTGARSSTPPIVPVQ
jgi:hypothetical protein